MANDHGEVVSAFKAQNVTEAHFVKDLLLQEGIEATVTDENEPLAGLSIVPPDVMVRAEDEARGAGNCGRLPSPPRAKRHCPGLDLSQLQRASSGHVRSLFSVWRVAAAIGMKLTNLWRRPRIALKKLLLWRDHDALSAFHLVGPEHGTMSGDLPQSCCAALRRRTWARAIR